MKKKSLLDQLRELLGIAPKISGSNRYRAETVTVHRQHTQSIRQSDRIQQTQRPQRQQIRSNTSRSGSNSSKIEWKSVESKCTPRQRKAPENKGQIDWAGSSKSESPNLSKLIGIEDAFDHTPLLAGEQIAFCRRDKVAYHHATWQFLRAQNQGRCCICGQTNVFEIYTLPGTYAGPPVPVTTFKPRVTLRPGEKIINLEDAPKFINLVVNFEDYVHEVYCTKASGTYFVRFQKRKYGDTPFSGFKLVIFPDYVSAWHAAGMSIENYRGRKIRVRGLIQKHEKWGMEILVNSPNMIEIID